MMVDCNVDISYMMFITQRDCLGYLDNGDTEKLVLLDVPYIGSENTCGIAGYKYQPFHQKVAQYLQKSTYPFIYYCRSTPPKSECIFNRADAEHIMKMKLAQYFMNQGFYFQKVHFEKDTELMVSNRLYDTGIQFQWADIDEIII